MDLKVFDESNFNTQIAMAKDMLLDSDISGCITGSSLITDDFHCWESKPDIDVFVFNEISFGYAMAYVEAHGFTPGGKGKLAEAEETRKSWTLATGFSKKYPINTIQYCRGDVAINITYKKDCENMLDVIASFDMSIVMIAQDLTTGNYLDLRGDDIFTARPNPYKNQLYNHPSRFTVARAIRQWDRDIKYAGRGYDVTPMAYFYVNLIDQVLETGAVFGTDADNQSFAELEPGFIEMKNLITKWLEENDA